MKLALQILRPIIQIQGLAVIKRNRSPGQFQENIHSSYEANYLTQINLCTRFQKISISFILGAIAVLRYRRHQRTKL